MGESGWGADEGEMAGSEEEGSCCGGDNGVEGCEEFGGMVGR